jgi:hypothetical protein
VKNFNNCLENVCFQATGGKQKNMWPKSMEYVAKTRGYVSEKLRICGQNTRICVRKAQNMWPKDLWPRFALRQEELQSAAKIRCFELECGVH